MLKDDVVFFLKVHPDPEDKMLHTWAEENGYDVHEVETEIYKLATKYVAFLTGGQANEIGLSEEDVDPDELEIGIDIESEHVDDEEMQKRMALDHLAENEFYYSLLQKLVEKE